MGKRHAEVINGLCPRHLKSPYGKNINVSFVFSRPFSIFPPHGGSDFLIIKVLAKKSGFVPTFVREQFADSIKINGTTNGLIHRVSLIKDS